MFKVPRALGSFFLVVIAHAQSPLVQVTDTIHNSDGTLFSGVLTIESHSSLQDSPDEFSAFVNQGYLSAFLSPTIANDPPYTVTYYTDMSSGVPIRTETWIVPQSTSVLKLADVIKSTTYPGVDSSSAAGSQPPATVSRSTVALPLPISDVLGLSGDLATINQSVASLQTSINTPQGSSATLTSLSASVSTLSSSVTALSSQVTTSASAIAGLTNSLSGLSSTVSAQSGTLNALTATIASLGSSTATNSTDIATIKTTLNSLVAQVNSLTALLHQNSLSQESPTFISETPAGTMDGINQIFTLTFVSSPTTSVHLYRNGLLLSAGGDYTIIGQTITFSKAAVPFPGDSLDAQYRH